MSLFGGKARRAQKEQIKRLEALDGRLLKYVTRRENEGEIVLGKDGRIVTAHENACVLCEGREIFCHPKDTVTCGELLSKDGVVLTCGEDTVVAYYKYYR